MDPIPTQLRQTTLPGSASPPLSDEFYAVLVEANRSLMALPASFNDCPEVRDLGVAVTAGKTRARQIIEQSGGVAIADRLMEASIAFRSTGHFRQCSLLERVAFAIAGWERRRNPRRR